MVMILTQLLGVPMLVPSYCIHSYHQGVLTACILIGLAIFVSLIYTLHLYSHMREDNSVVTSKEDQKTYVNQYQTFENENQ